MIELEYFTVRQSGNNLLFELKESGMNSPGERYFTVGAMLWDGKLRFVVNQNCNNSNPSLTAEAFSELGKVYTVASELLQAQL